MEKSNHAFKLLVGLMLSFCIAVGWFVATSTASDIYSAVIISMISAVSLYGIFIIVIFAIDSIIQTVKKDPNDK
jgi:hypothetical protein